MRLTRSECSAKYGPIVEGKDADGKPFLYWPNEAQHCMTIRIPPPLCFAIKNSFTGKRWDRLYCNRDMAAPLMRAFQNVLDAGRIWELRTFDGCYNVRMVRGSKTNYSAHSWALAIDLNAGWNPLGGQSSWSKTFIDCFEREGFVWGGRFERGDPMHWSWVGF